MADDTTAATRPGQNAFLCRDCGATEPPRGGIHCRHCGSPRVVRHDELHALAIAHIDCDAFYASVEKRDRPDLADKPVIIGGRHRGVVATCCYLARMRGVRSAMPMFQARKLCPDAVLIPPDMAKYKAVGLEIRERMRDLTDLVEPLSIDEAYLDLTHALGEGDSPASRLAALARRIEREVGVTVSVGLSYNKFLAKIASDLDKPRGFAVIGRAQARDFLADKPVTILWGVGRALAAKLAAAGITRVGQLQRLPEAELIHRYGKIGGQLAAFARGEDSRRVTPHRPTKSISSETTFNEDLTAFEALDAELAPLCAKVGERLVRSRHVAHGVVLKLKTADFQILTRSRRLARPGQSGEEIHRVAAELLRAQADGRAFRLIGVGAAPVTPIDREDGPDLFSRDSGADQGMA